MNCTCDLGRTKDIAIIIRSLREDFLLCNDEIAQLCGVTIRTIKRWEWTKRAAGKNVKHLYEIKATIRLLELMHFTHDDIRQWLRARNYWLNKETPLEVIGRREMEKVSDAIIDQFEIG